MDGTMIIILAAVAILFYLISVFGCCVALIEKDVLFDFFTIFLILCPLVNTIIGIRHSHFRDTIKKLKGQEK